MAVFTINPLAQEGKGKANVHVIVSPMSVIASIAFVMCIIADNDSKCNIWNV